MLNNLVIKIKESEGFVGKVYKDTLGFDTIGYGTKLPLSKIEATLLLRMRMDAKIKELSNKYNQINTMPTQIQEVLIEMAYQMGVGGLMKFRKTLHYLEIGEYEKASVEMLDSKWAEQTPNRAKKMSSIIKEI